MKAGRLLSWTRQPACNCSDHACVHALSFFLQRTPMEALVHTLDGNMRKLTRFQEGVYLVIPPEFLTFFSASTSAGAALVGLLFVAVSLAPEQIVTRRAPVERRAVAGSAFTALINAFFVSLVALIPHFNVGTPIVLFSSLSLLTSLIQAWSLLRLRKGWQSFLRRVVLVCLSCGLYGLELRNGVGLITDPTQVGFVYGQLFTLLGIVALGLIRAWELLGAHRYGFGGWLNPLQDVDDSEAFSRADNADSASGSPPTGEAAPRSLPQ
jgi:hypothetical protein